MNAPVDFAVLKDAWLALDRKLERQHALEFARFRQGRFTRARLYLVPLYLGALLSLVLGVLVVVPAGSFWIAHRSEPAPLVAGLMLHLYGVLLIGFGVAELLHLARIDFAAPLLLIQRRLAELHAQRLRGALVLGLSWWLLWIPLLECLARAFAGIDVYERAPAWMLGNLAVGVLGIALSLLVLRWFARRAAASPQRDPTAFGWWLGRARRQVEEVERFEREA